MVVVHIPHASRLILPEDREALLVDDATLARELLCMTDAWTDRLVEGFRLPAIRVIFPVSRLPDLPASYMSAFKAPPARGFDNQLVRAFPNITAVDMTSICAPIGRPLARS